MASIAKLGLSALATPVREHCTQIASERRQRESQRTTNDFLQGIAEMRDSRRYNFAGDTLDGIYTTVEHAGYVTAGQRRAVNNIRRGCGEGEI